MAVNVITKEKAVETKTETKKKVKSKDIMSKKDVDKFGANVIKLNRKKAQLKPLENKVGNAEKDFLAKADELLDAGETFTLLGKEFDIELGAKGSKTVITDKEKVLELLGEKVFFELAQISITDLKKYLTEDQIEEVTETTRPNKRRAKVEPK